MSIWRPESIDEEPEVVMTSWSIFEINGKDRHFCGYNVLLREGRVSSRIEEFDRQTMQGRTASGRVYKLKGLPGCDPDARYVWSRWCKINGIDAGMVRNISEEMIDAQ